MKINKKIAIDHLGRVEGHGGIHVEVRDGKVTKVNMDIYEGSRFYEELIVGKHYEEVAGIVCRVCAICSADHLLASQSATEKAFGIEVSRQTYLLRGLLLHGSMIESHALHVYALALPDLLGFDGVIGMAGTYPKEVTIALELKKLGNLVQELVGGRAIHPINPVIGGFGVIPTNEQLIDLKSKLEKGLQNALLTVDLYEKLLPLPAFADSPTVYTALVPREPRYSYLGDKIHTTLGDCFSVEDYRKVCHERVVSHSHAKQSLYANQPFMTGSLARLNLNHKHIKGNALEVQKRLLPDLPNTNILHNNTAQLIELIHSLERSIILIDHLLEEGIEPEEPVKVEPRAGKGVGAMEVPRGILYHAYEYDENGYLVDADVITPTAQNLANAEKDLRTAVEQLMSTDEEQLRLSLEMVARAYDPCISCAVHLIDLKMN
jgi:sulfhydrogenase subunit alpha